MSYFRQRYNYSLPASTCQWYVAIIYCYNFINAFMMSTQIFVERNFDISKQKQKNSQKSMKCKLERSWEFQMTV